MREKKIIKLSILGIITNILLVIFKAIVGILANSIAIIIDAMNNLSDVLSSIITIVGIKLSNKKPDKEHPYGHGRIEYFASVLIAIIVLAAGILALKESVLKIITPPDVDYSIITLIIILIAVITKIMLGSVFKKQGKELNSTSLQASGIDALSDAVLSFSTFICAIIFLIWHITLEGFIGVLISVIIIRTAINILKDTIDDIIGARTDSDIVNELKKIISNNKLVLGVYDITCHNYGPNTIIATAHIQVDDNLTAKEIHKLTRKIAEQVYEKMGILLTIGIYAANNDEEYKNIKKDIQKIIKKHSNILQMHGFYVDDENSNISFDLIFNYDEQNPQNVVEKIVSELNNKYPKYDFNVVIDRDFSE